MSIPTPAGATEHSDSNSPIVSLVVGLNGATRKIHSIRNNRLIRVYHVSGEFGTSTENNFPDSLVIARANYSHVWPDKLTAVLSSMQASHQKKMFELCGVDIKSNAAYEIAKRGLIRPADSTLPVVYGIKCVQFDRPRFTVEVHAINEHVKYLGQLVQVCDVGWSKVRNISIIFTWRRVTADDFKKTK